MKGSVGSSSGSVVVRDKVDRYPTGGYPFDKLRGCVVSVTGEFCRLSRKVLGY